LTLLDPECWSEGALLATPAKKLTSKSLSCSTEAANGERRESATRLLLYIHLPLFVPRET